MLVLIALVSVGYQLQLSQVRGKVAALTVGLVFKLALAPALILLLFAGLLGAGGQTLRVTVLQAAMAPIIGASIVAIDHELNRRCSPLMVGVGIPLSFLTLPVWWRLLSFCDRCWTLTASMANGRLRQLSGVYLPWGGATEFRRGHPLRSGNGVGKTGSLVGKGMTLKEN